MLKRKYVYESPAPVYNSHNGGHRTAAEGLCLCVGCSLIGTALFWCLVTLSGVYSLLLAAVVTALGGARHLPIFFFFFSTVSQ